MRKKLLVGAVFLAISTMFAGANISSVSAESVESDTKVKTITYKEIVVGVGSDTSKATFSDEFATYGLGYGKVTEDLSSIKKYETVTPSESNSFLFVDAGQTVSTDDWQIYTNQNNGAIMYITAKQGMKLTAVNNNLGGWTDDATFSYYLRETDNTLTTLFTKVGVKGTDVGIEVYMDAGDTFYMEYIFEWAQRNLQSPPSFTLNVAAYETKMEKEAALADLETAFAGYKEADYSTANWEIITSIYNSAKESVNNGTTVEEIRTVTDKALADMAAVLSAAEEEAELANAKTKALKILENVFAGYKEADYSIESWKLLGEIFQTAKTEINAGDTLEGVADISEQAEKDMAAVKTIADEGADELETAFAAYNRADYSSDNWAKLTQIIENAKKSLSSAESNEVSAIVEQALTEMDEIKTLAEEGADALAIAKSAAVAEVDAVLAEYDEMDYSVENWKKLADIAAKAELDIDAAADEAALERIVAKAKEDFATVSTLKDEAFAELDEEFEKYEQSDYSEKNWNSLIGIISSAKEELESSKASGFSEIVEKAREELAAVKTLAEEAEGELETYKETKTEELKTYVAGLDKTDYTEENWKQIDEIIKNFEAKLSELKNREEVTDAFNQAKSAIDNVEVFSPVSDTFDMDSMVKYAVTKKLSGAVDYGNVQVQLLGGTIDEPAEYDNFIIMEGADGNNQYLLSKAGMDAFDSCDSAFMPWRLKYNSASWAIIKITADVDTKLIVSHDAFNGGWVQGGAFIAGYIKGINRLGTMQTVQFYHEYLTSVTGEENQFGFVVQLAQGDEFYFVVGNEYMTGVNVEGNLNIIPKFEVKTEEYSSDDRNAVFDEANALEIAKESAREELNEEFSKYIKEEYSIERWAEIEYIRDGALDDIAAAETEDILDEIVGKAKEEMAAIPDLEKEEAELSAHKNEKLQELKDYVASLGEKNYSKENWEKIQGIVADFEKAIADMDDTNKISKEFNNAKRDIDAVETEKGCGSVLLMPLLFVAITMTVAGICLINKKRKV